jgi:heat shock protein HslJ
MKKIINLAFCTVFLLYAIAFPSIAHGAPARDPSAVFNDVEGKEWILSEIKKDGSSTVIDRQKLSADGMGGFFTVSFSEGRLSGMGAPNRCFGPYSVSANRSLNIGNIASTMMAAFREPDDLKESEYFDYLSKVKRWDIWEGKLELCSINSNGTETVLIFLIN